MHNTPQELIDHIIDFAHDDRPTLYSARLVSRTWNVSARIHVFRRLDLLIPEPPAPRAAAVTYTPTCHPNPTSENHIDTDSSPGHMSTTDTDVSHKPGQTENAWELEKFKSLLDFLKCTPDMAHFVREVVLGNTTYIRLDSDQWKTYEVLISHILSRLKRVTTLFLFQVNWSQLSPVFSSSLGVLCRSSELRNLDLWNCEMPSIDSLMDFLNLSSRLSNLRLSHIRFQVTQRQELNEIPPSMTSKFSQRPKTPLDSLSLDTVTLTPLLFGLFANPYFSYDVSKLRRLLLSHINDVPSMGRFLQLAGSSLEHLEMRGSSYQSKRAADHHAVNLSRTPRLKSMRISGLQWRPNLCPAECLRHIFDIPAQSNTNNDTKHPLESLHITIHAIKRRNEEYDYGKWEILDEILSRPTFASLATVDIGINTTLIGSRDVDSVKLTRSFLRLQAANKIRVVCFSN